MYRIRNFFKRLRLSQVLLTLIASSLLVVSTACSQSPSAVTDTPRTVDKSAALSRDASDVAKRQLIEKAQRLQPTNPIDALGEKAEDLSDDVSRSARDLKKQTQRTLEDASDAAQDKASDVLKKAT
ncbi:MAG: hypothetical protein WA902_13330 [Thermosynechococcaceae cyanobacterium]